MKLDYMMNAYDVAMELGVSKGHVYKVIRKLNAELEASGYIVVSGRVPRAYWEKKFYGYETKMKELKKGALEWENNCKMSANANMDMMLGSFVEIYFRDKAGELKERSVKNKRYMIKTHILPYFENKPMNSITPADIIQWQNIIRAKGFAPTYLRMIQNQITALFTHASNIYNLANNPCKKVKKMGKSDADRIDFGTREEYDRFIETFEVGSRYYVLFETLFWTGCREGELLALTKSDFDFYNNKLHISKTYYRTDCKDIITTPKTEQSVRTIDIPEFLKCEIKEYVDRLYELPDDERIFPIVAEAVQHALKRHAEKDINYSGKFDKYDEDSLRKVLVGMIYYKNGEVYGTPIYNDNKVIEKMAYAGPEVGTWNAAGTEFTPYSKADIDAIFQKYKAAGLTLLGTENVAVYQDNTWESEANEPVRVYMEAAERNGLGVLVFDSSIQWLLSSNDVSLYDASYGTTDAWKIVIDNHIQTLQQSNSFRGFMVWEGMHSQQMLRK